MGKKVLFVTGAGRSGSTLLGLMLGNGPNCFAAGELYALFWPRRPFHRLRDGCFCDVDSCTFWREIKSSGKRNAYKSIFESRNVETVVDTSKHPLWLEDQLRYSVGERYSIKSIVIYKEPKEFARSLEKRGQLGRWKSM